MFAMCRLDDRGRRFVIHRQYLAISATASDRSPRTATGKRGRKIIASDPSSSVQLTRILPRQSSMSMDCYDGQRSTGEAWTNGRDSRSGHFGHGSFRMFEQQVKYRQ